MFDAPRCREWTPLATQQLRLRNLIQIVGYNIRPPEHEHAVPGSACLFYYTLHETGMSAPFYKSERIASAHPKWRELHAEVTQRKASNNVIIRIWCHIQHENAESHKNDTIIQTWGVYFSGLRLIGANLALDFTSDSFKPNTLVFQMHGGYFCSYKSLNLEVIPTENLYEYSVSSGSSKTSTTQRIPIEANYLQNHRIIKESRSISPSKRNYRNDEYSKSNSPTDQAFRQNFGRFKPSSSVNIYRRNGCEISANSPDEVKVFTMSDSDVSKHSSKDDLSCGIDLSETAENYDLRQDDVPKYRYLCLNFLKSEIRPSYNVSKLQNLHLLQYSIKKRKDAIKELKESIYKKSAIEKESPSPDCQLITARSSVSPRSLFLYDEESDSDRSIKSKCSSQSDETIQNGPRLTLKLNDLLSLKANPSPHQRLEHARLTRKMEIARFKRKLLADERDAKTGAIRKLKQRHAKMYEDNQDLGSELMTGYHALSRRTERLAQSHRSAAALRQLVARAAASLHARRGQLASELVQLFQLQCRDERWHIVDIHLPPLDDDSRRLSAHVGVAVGYAAQCLMVAAKLLDLPLRYPVRMRGSESEIYDHLTPELPQPRVLLCSRSGDATLLRYGVFLLNKCLAQLLWARGVVASDLRSTLFNLHRLLSGASSSTSQVVDSNWLPNMGCPHSQSLRSLVASERGQRRQFNRFKDSIDGHSPESEHGLKRHRHSRSVGSCRDDRELGKIHVSTVSIMGSEPFLHGINSCDLLMKCSNLKPHNSDSQISTFSTERNVVFTMGGDILQTDGSPLLVKISSNNGDYCSECKKDLKNVCRAIEDQCERDGQNCERFHAEIGEGEIDIKREAKEDKETIKESDKKLKSFDISTVEDEMTANEEEIELEKDSCDKESALLSNVLIITDEYVMTVPTVNDGIANYEGTQQCSSKSVTDIKIVEDEKETAIENNESCTGSLCSLAKDVILIEADDNFVENCDKIEET